ncbi:MAG TPA: TIGR03619 family F420-dependent LLM class oxidoreductase [Myxococcota bacterium]|nr:TIGR03619 family F420-dependent LLM class oxidoreductase [Myxococcota bacterium]
MKFGLYGINVGACADPATAATAARLAEHVGFDSVWTGEHVVLPDPQAPPSPLPPHTPLLDPAVALAFVAAHTQTIRLATGIIILPQRNPLVLAKELASVDVVSGGRLLFGIGAGYLAPEFAALGIPFADRGRRTDEYLDAMLALWDEPSPRYQGKFVAFSGIDAKPRPIQRPHPPIHVGGQSRGAYRRALGRGNGWYGFALDVDHTQRCLADLSAVRGRVARPAELGPLEITITPPPGLRPDDVARYADLGVHRLVLLILARDGTELVAQVERAAETFLGRSQSSGA